MRQAIAIAIATLILPICCLVVVSDQWTGASLDIVFNVIALVIGGAISALAWMVGRKRIYGFLTVPILLLLVFLRLVDLSPVKPAVRGVAMIQPGMTESEVRGVFEHQFPEHGRFKRPEMGPLRNDTLSFVLDPNDGRYNAAVVEVQFQSGLSTTARFLPD